MSSLMCSRVFQSVDSCWSLRTLTMMSRQLRFSACHCNSVDRKEVSKDKQDQVPKSVLNNISAKIKSRLNVEMNPQYKDNLVSNVWESSLTINWPDLIQTVGRGNSKSQAQHEAAQLALSLLKQKNIIGEDGNLQPVQKIMSLYTLDDKISPSKNKKNKTSKVSIAQLKNEKILVDRNINPSHKSETSVCKAVLEMVARRFPQPKATLHNVFVEVAHHLRSDAYCAIPSYSRMKDSWQCSYHLRWPSHAVFSGEGHTKSQAAKIAALYALNWLTAQGRLLKDGTPCIERRMEMPPPPLVALPSEFERQLNTLHTYFQCVKNTIADATESCTEVLQDADTVDTETGTVTQTFSFNIKNETVFKNRSSELQRRLERRMKMGSRKSELPIYQFREQLLELLENNRVLIIRGETGCGKSTQVPQFIFDDWIKKGHGSECTVVVTEPRRIAAISLAERVAEERDERVGDTVGYHVRLQSRMPQGPGGLLYMSSGMLLHHLQKNPVLTGVTHVILDEAHERDTNIDVLAILLRRALLHNPELHVIVMSATIDASLFQNYFDAPLMEVPGFTFPVTEHFLDDLVSQNVLKKLPDSTVPYVDVDLVCTVIDWLHQNKGEGAILCFLPGWADIKAVMEKVNNIMNKSELFVVPVHSRISYTDQQKIFSRPPPGIRKIILATNIAETSITVNDVKYVVDTGLHREQRLSSDTGTSSIGNRWISKVNVKQRRGRAGRLQPGESFHLFDKKRFESMDDYPLPEVLRVPLEKTILYCKGLIKNQKAAQFLSEMPEPPSEDAIQLGVSELVAIGALDDDENLTALGKRIMNFPTHPKLSKVLVNAAVLRCTQPVLTITTVLSGEVDLFQGALTEKDNIRETKREHHPTSDHIALWKIHRMLWQMKTGDFRSLCQHMNINVPSIDLIARLNKLFSEYLYECKILCHSEKLTDDASPCNKYQLHDELVKAVLMSGLGNLLVKRNWKIMNGRIVKDTNLTVTELEQHATITPDSVNYKHCDNSSPYLTHFNEIKSLERRSLLIRESSVVSPLCVILFKPGELVAEKYEASSSGNSTVKGNSYVVLSLKSKGTVKMLCEKRDAEQLQTLRTIIWWVLDYYIRNEGSSGNECNRTVDKFREFLLKVIVDVLAYKK
ncbi:ATP-dependent RNA helicase DHX30-like isoform X1 [Schistocerca gregaria]|uniref:ATP-dependent RNA helicase DHX30-like isoform X1 n=2 Tax=Schistocerca gregaria TaxID=7010 RepID=UPI00211DDA5F|nr:ATP-dependent RNA helicase DHX30-like isoform X1 [Schistocerca gregaria]